MSAVPSNASVLSASNAYEALKVLAKDLPWAAVVVAAELPLFGPTAALKSLALQYALLTGVRSLETFDLVRKMPWFGSAAARLAGGTLSALPGPDVGAALTIGAAKGAGSAVAGALLDWMVNCCTKKCASSTPAP
ncbi:MAG: hypothetical protein EBX40_01035 [Gammaproteobacteria bacterium]|nr:hypothetical protein [Gammaproteobacteria bacterium]